MSRKGTTVASRLNRRELLAMLGSSSLVPTLISCKPDDTTMEPRTEVELHYLDLREVARRIEARDISPVELTELMLDRIERLDTRLHSYATVMADHARAQAKVAEEEIGRGDYRGPLHGVPIAVKDLAFTTGVTTSGGLAVLADFVPDFDATVVSRLHEAGSVLLGKLNLTEGAMGAYHRDFQIPVNPWREDLWVGASSSGSGVATAAGLCFASLGTDTGGSIRYPAMANGVVGLKPTYGRVSRYGVLDLAESLDHVGPMTRRTGDAAVVFEAIAGFDPDDPTSLREPIPDMLGEIERGIAGVRIGIDRAYATVGVEPGLAAAIEEAVMVLKGLGAEIVEVEMPDVTAAPAAWDILCAVEAVKAHASTYPSRADDYGDYFRDHLERGAAASEEQRTEAQRVRDEVTEGLERTLSTIDALVAPAAGSPFALPREPQYQSMAVLNQAYAEALSGYDPPLTPGPMFTIPADFAGTPSLSLQCGQSSEGLPYTLQLMGADLTEAMLCRIGHAYEEATDWHRRHPPV